MQYKTYTFRAYPNKTQEKLMYLTFTMCRTIYNSMLKAILKNYSSYIYMKYKSVYQMKNHLIVKNSQILTKFRKYLL